MTITRSCWPWLNFRGLLFSDRKQASADKDQHARLELFVHFYGWFETSDSLYLAMEYFPLGDLHKCVASSGVCTEDEAKAVACQLLEGLNFMHQMGFTHRDLKPQVSYQSPKNLAYYSRHSRSVRLLIMNRNQECTCQTSIT